jgi:hypothetical protein
LTLSIEELRSTIGRGGRVKVRKVNGKPYLYLVYPNGSERCAGRLDRLPEDVRRWVESVRRRSKIGSEDKGGQSGSQGVQAQTPAQQLVNARVEGGRIVVEREVELETIWNVRRIALDPRVYILYAYAQKYLGYPGSLGEFLSDCVILWFKERGIEVALRTMD